MKRIVVVWFAVLAAFTFTVGLLTPTPVFAEKKKADPDKEKAKKEAEQKSKEAMKKAQEDKARGKAGATKGEKPKKDTKPLSPSEIGG